MPSKEERDNMYKDPINPHLPHWRQPKQTQYPVGFCGIILHLLSKHKTTIPNNIQEDAMKQDHGRAHPGPMRKPICICGMIGIRDKKFDTYYCPTSGVWLESKCEDPNCEHCANRPKIHT
jgi:hypothetical protein